MTMDLSYLDILEQCFRERFRGYDRREVDTFIQLVAQEFKTLEDQVGTLQQQLEESQRQLKHLKAQGAGADPRYSPEAMRDKARKIVRLAREQGLKQKKVLDTELRRLQSDIERLRNVKKDLLEDFKSNARVFFTSEGKSGGDGT